MIEHTLTVGLVVDRIAPTSQWASAHWRPETVFATPPETPPWTVLARAGERTRYYAGEQTIRLYSTDTANYRDNLESGAPKLWVVMQPEGDEPPVPILSITADPAEGEAHTETGTNRVETVAMPPPIAAAVAEFIAAHHVERPIIKRRRDRAEPDVRWRDGRGGDDSPDPGKRRGG